MSVNLALRRADPARIHIKVSPVVDAIIGLRLVREWWQPTANPDRAAGPALHSTLHHPGAHAPNGTGRATATDWPRMDRVKTRPPCTPPCAMGPTVPANASAAAREILEADLRYRMSRMLKGGVLGLFEDLHPSVSLEGDVLRLNSWCDAEFTSPTRCLTLIPSLRCGPRVLFITDPTHPPILLYPARHAGAYLDAVGGLNRVRAPATSLDDLVGARRRRLLQSLVKPRTIDEVATGLGLHPLQVRSHLLALESARLVAAEGSPARYQRTPLASLLTCPLCSCFWLSDDLNQ